MALAWPTDFFSPRLRHRLAEQRIRPQHFAVAAAVAVAVAVAEAVAETPLAPAPCVHSRRGCGTGMVGRRFLVVSVIGSQSSALIRNSLRLQWWSLWRWRPPPCRRTAAVPLPRAAPQLPPRRSRRPPPAARRPPPPAGPPAVPSPAAVSRRLVPACRFPRASWLEPDARTCAAHARNNSISSGEGHKKGLGPPEWHPSCKYSSATCATHMHSRRRRRNRGVQSRQCYSRQCYSRHRHSRHRHSRHRQCIRGIHSRHPIAPCNLAMHSRHAFEGRGEFFAGERPGGSSAKGAAKGKQRAAKGKQRASDDGGSAIARGGRAEVGNGSAIARGGRRRVGAPHTCTPYGVAP